jgi:hypothetical protein
MRKRSWLRLALATSALLLGVNAGISLALQHGWARRPLLERLSASFGRPVEVARFRFSLLNGLRLEADSVTVAEDPRFGDEYFLRADRLTASLRWTALLHGRIELGALSLNRPSLNLVHTADGHWNIESWLPPANPAATTSPASSRASATADAPVSRIAARLSRIDVDGGRINFKRGVEKLPFALVDVAGDLEEDDAGRWSIDLEADPVRAPIALQAAGTLHLRGTAAGTSARLRPAAFTLTWEDASLADAMRLLGGGDYGMRGAVGAELSAAIGSPPAAAGGITADEWAIQGKLRLSGAHRWDLAESAGDPALNATLAVVWRPGQPRLELTSCIVEGPRSRVDGRGALDWAHGLNPSVQIVSSDIGFADLLAWRRAFLPGVTPDLSIDGAVAVDATLVGWPPRILQANAASGGAVVRVAALSGPIRIGRAEASLWRGLLVLNPTPVDLPGRALRTAARNQIQTEAAPAGSLEIEGALGPFLPGDWPRDWRYRLAVAGGTQRSQDLIALAGAFGRPVNTEWSVEGPVAFKLTRSGALRRGTSATNGTLGFSGLQVTSVVLNQSIIVEAASVDLKDGDRRIRLGSVQALGSHWTGLLHRRAADGAWDFDLSADRLDAAELDRWLGPRARPSLFDRMLPFGALPNSAPARDAAIARVVARGRLRVGEVALAPLQVEKLDADVALAGRGVVLHRAQAELYGGRIAGDFEAQLSAVPTYSFRGRIDRVDLGGLADATASLAGRFAGLASGTLALTARGIGRQYLAASLEGEGVLRARDAVLRGIDLPSLLTGTASDPKARGEARFGTSAATFHIAAGRVSVDQFLLEDRDQQLEVEGTVDFARRLDLLVRTAPRETTRGADFDPETSEGETWAIAGTLDAPQVARQTPVAGNRATSSGVRR